MSPVVLFPEPSEEPCPELIRFGVARHKLSPVRQPMTASLNQIAEGQQAATRLRSA